MQDKIKAAPTVVYPESDGKPTAETEYHRDIMIDFIQMLKHYFRDVDDVHVSGNLLMYCQYPPAKAAGFHTEEFDEEGNPRKSVSPDVFVTFGVRKKSDARIKYGKKDTPPILCWKSQVQAHTGTI